MTPIMPPNHDTDIDVAKPSDRDVFEYELRRGLQEKGVSGDAAGPLTAWLLALFDAAIGEVATEADERAFAFGAASAQMELLARFAAAR